MKIYISLPISGKDLATQQALASQIVERIKALGHEPVNPFDTSLASPEMSEKEQYAYYMGEDIKRLLMCDAAYFCEGYYKSAGCRTEVSVADNYGIIRFHDLKLIPKNDVQANTYQ